MLKGWEGLDLSFSGDCRRKGEKSSIQKSRKRLRWDFSCDHRKRLPYRGSDGESYITKKGEEKGNAAYK